MGLVERLRELEQLRKQGVITDSEYAALVANATESEEPTVLAPPPTPAAMTIPPSVIVTPSAAPRVPRQKLLIGAGVGVVLIAIIGVVASSGSGGNPADSSEYKKLLVEKETLTKEIAATKAKTNVANAKISTVEGTLAKTQESVTEYQRKVDKVNAILNDLMVMK